MMSIANILMANNHVTTANKMSKRNISKLKSQIKELLGFIRSDPDVFGRVNRRTNRGHKSDSVSTLSSPLNFYLPILISCFMFNLPISQFPIDFATFYRGNVGKLPLAKIIFYPHWNRAILIIQASYWLIKIFLLCIPSKNDCSYSTAIRAVSARLINAQRTSWILPNFRVFIIIIEQF